MGGHKSVQQMTMNIGPMFVFLRMYLIAVCLDVRRRVRRRGVAGAARGRPRTAGRARSDHVLSPRAAAPSRFFSSGRYCTICACDCGRGDYRLPGS